MFLEYGLKLHAKSKAKLNPIGVSSYLAYQPYKKSQHK